MAWNDEYYLQVAVVDYLNHAYPGVIYRSDLAGVRLHRGLRVKIKKIQKPDFKYPDLFIAERRPSAGGLYLELKTSRNKIYTKNGELRQDKHTQEQAEALNILRKKGYCAEFACGIDEAIKIIDNYMGGGKSV